MNKQVSTTTKSFAEQAEHNANLWKDRLYIEYWQLSNRIEHLEKTINSEHFEDLGEANCALLRAQRNTMIDYKDILFKRACVNKINLFRDDGAFTKKPKIAARGVKYSRFRREKSND